MSDWLDAEHHIERARQFFEQSRWAEAESELREAIAIDPSRPEWHFNLGLTLEATGRDAEAHRAFREALDLEEDNPRTLLALGSTAVRLGDPDAAETWFQKATRLEPNDPEPYVHLIDVYGEMGKHEQAELMFYMAMQLPDADQAVAYLNIAESLLDRREHERAIWCLRSAAQLEPALPRVHARLAEAQAAVGRLDRARQLFLRELRNNPGDVETLLDLGSLLVDMNRLVEAGEKFRRVLEMETDNAEAHFRLADVAQRLGRTGQAISGLRLVLRLDATHGAARRRLAGLLVKRGDTDDAQRLLQRELRTLAHDAESFGADDFDELGGLLLAAGLPAEAVQVFERVVALRPEEARSHHHLAVAHLHAGDARAGLRACQAALKIDPAHVAAMHNVALALMREGRWITAGKWVRRARAVDPDDPSLRRLRARMWLRAAGQSLKAAALGVGRFLRAVWGVLGSLSRRLFGRPTGG